ncbi:MAG TPA: hypothetical protein VFZ19_10920, partial [Solirubrobacterales bacterium]
MKSFSQLPEGVIPLTPDQFVLAFQEADLINQIGDAYRLGSSLSDLDLANPKIVGSDARRVIEEHLDQTEKLLVASQELAIFDPQEPANELRDLAGEAGRYGAELAAAFIEVLTAPTYPE